MPTLRAMFRLFDGYTNTINRINRSTSEATNRILRASGTTDQFNNRLRSTGASANTASIGMGKLIGTLISFAAAKKAMDIMDNFTNTTARLSLINDGLQTQAELQEKIYQAANRSKGAYGEMANAISKMGLMAGDQFKSNDELIAFTELLQKSFKVGGSSVTEQSAALLQLTQAMGAGKLQGDEFRSIMENAPMIADAIAKYTKKSKGELKEMSSEGLITSDIIKNAMFLMSDDINKKFGTMPMTFADIWNKVKNGGLKAFQPVMKSINGLINTKGFQDFLNSMINGINMVGSAIGWLINFIISNWDIIGPILMVIGTTLLINIITGLWAMIAPLGIQFALWLAMNMPIMIVIASILMIAYALNAAGVTMQDVFAFMGGAISALITILFNMAKAIGNVFIGIAKVIDSVITGAINLVLKGVNLIISALNKIPGVNIGSVDEFKGFTSNLKYMEYGNVAESYQSGKETGKNVYTGVSSKLKDFTSKFDITSNNNTTGANKFGNPLDKPITVKGKGKNDAIDVDMSDEDIRYLRDIAERDYVNKFSTATLAPNIQVSFGDVREEADVNKVAGRIKKILQEEIAMASEGVYA